MFGFFHAVSGAYAALKTSTVLALAALLTVSSAGCSLDFMNSNHSTIATEDSQAIRPLTEAEALADFDAMVSSLNSLYGPLEYKERRFGYKFENEAAKVRSKFPLAKTDSEKSALFLELLRKLEDGHVSLSQPIRDRYEIPVIVMPVENKFLVSRVAPSLAPYGIAVGDELVSIDGVTPDDALKTILKYSWFANAESDRHMIYYFFYRPSYIPELVPAAEFAQIKFLKPDGTEMLAQIAWKKTSPQQRVEFVPRAEESAKRTSDSDPFVGYKGLTSEALTERLNTLNSVSVADMGSDAPWYWSAKLKKKYQVTMVLPERERVQAFYAAWTREMDLFSPTTPTPDPLPETLPTVWAALYKYNGKTVLMLRQPGYAPADFVLNLAIYSALIDQYQPLADALIIDQTHNPGGIVNYTEGFAQLFAPKGLNGFVQFLNTDRLWFTRLMSFWTGLDPLTASTATGARILSLVNGLERDSEQGLRLGKTPFSFSLREILPPAPGGAVWKKPVLVLIDELCGSGGDSFPMLMKANGLGKLFGNRTAGLGGSVEKVIDLPYTRSSLSVTRGLFTTFKPNGQYSDSDYVENNGVTPDVSYTHTVKDFREGFETYFKAFSDEATK
jgi:hypothetical protein